MSGLPDLTGLATHVATWAGFIGRSPECWIHEQRCHLAGFQAQAPIPPGSPEVWVRWIEAERAEALKSVLLVADLMLIRACTRVQRRRNPRRGGRHYAPVQARAILDEALRDQDFAYGKPDRAYLLLALGPKRCLTTALREASWRNRPGEVREAIWWRRTGRGWSTLGETPQQREDRIRREGPRPTPPGARALNGQRRSA